MRSDADLGDLVHRPRADLHLEGTTVECDHCRVQALIEVVLRHGDVVVELIWDRSPDAMDRTERCVAVAKVLYDHANRIDVVNLGEVARSARHLLVDRIEMLRPTGELRGDPRSFKLWLQDCDRALHIVRTHIASKIDQARQLVIALRLKRLEGEILKLPLHLPDAEAFCKWGVDLKCLSGDAALLLYWQRG